MRRGMSGAATDCLARILGQHGCVALQVQPAGPQSEHQQPARTLRPRGRRFQAASRYPKGRDNGQPQSYRCYIRRLSKKAVEPVQDYGQTGQSGFSGAGFAE